MDILLHYFDEYAGDNLYSHLHNPLRSLATSKSDSAQYLAQLPFLDSLDRNNIIRQCLSLYVLTYIGIFILYFSVAGFSYYFMFDHRMKQHPRYLQNQVKKEILFSLDAFPMLDLLTLPWFLGDVRGYSKLYDSVAEGPFGAQGGWKPWAYMALSAAAFLFFTDYCIYWIHRWLHIPFFYKRLHKPHHKWIVPTPFASHAFHPVDGYLQSVPYHFACYLFPIHKYMFIGLFTFVNLWSILIHDSDMLCGHAFEHYINGPAHHTLHHLYFTCNYGQYFTWADKAGGSFRVPAKGDDPLEAVVKAIEKKKELEKQEKEQSQGQAVKVTALSAPPSVVQTPASERDEDELVDSGIGSEPSDDGVDVSDGELDAKKRQ
ncbi:c-5 sterol desaturase [Microbotryomycetes sp. JL221]|nr:c-5 sterol desaturase [Microbotryomycetes sp. JL221]